jgi:uncharacterized protein
MKMKVLSLLASVLAMGSVIPQAFGAEQKPLPTLSASDVEKIEAAIPAKATAKARHPHRILVFYRCEGFVHGGAIVAANKALPQMGQKTGAYQTDLSDDYAVLTKENLARYDALVLNNTTQLKIPTDAAKAALLDFVRSGKGLIAIHSASDNFYDWPEAASMVGGLFDGHPWTGDGTWAFRLDEPKHKLNQPFKGQGFKIKDEIYQFKAPYTRTDRRVLVTLDLSDPTTGGITKGVKRADKDFAVAWVKQFGKGRVFFCGFGHERNIFQDASMLQFYLDGIQYALGDLKAADKPLKK